MVPVPAGVYHGAAGPTVLMSPLQEEIIELQDLRMSPIPSLRNRHKAKYYKEPAGQLQVQLHAQLQVQLHGQLQVQLHGQLQALLLVRLQG